jgi:hypothetical protein
MPESFVQYPAASTGLKSRARQRVVGANTIQESHQVPPQEPMDDARVVSYRGRFASFRLAGSAANPINLFTLYNNSASVLVALTRLSVDVQYSTNAAYILNGYIRLWRGTTVPSGGTALAKHTTDTTKSSDANVTLLGPTASDGGAATPITYATPSTNPMCSQAEPQSFASTSVGQWLTDDMEMWSESESPLILRQGESILVAHHGANSATHMHYTVKGYFEEFTLP